jgi:hypothetical protein
MFSQRFLTFKKLSCLSCFANFLTTSFITETLKSFMKVLKVIKIILNSERKEISNYPSESNYSTSIMTLFSSPNEEKSVL